MPDKIQITLVFANGKEIPIEIESMIAMELNRDIETGEKTIYIRYK